VWQAYNNLAQELGDPNTDKRRFWWFQIYEKLLIRRKMSQAVENFTVNANGLFKQAISSIRLKKAWCQIKNGNTLSTLNSSWFKKNSIMLINGTFRYPMIKRIHFIKLKKNSSIQSLHIINPRVKIIERALLNSLDIIFEGAYTWSTVLKAEFKNAEANLRTTIFKNKYAAIIHSKTAKFTYQKKVQITRRVFKSSSFGYRTDKSVHQALHYVKTRWSPNTVYFLKYSVIHIFENIHKKRLKNTFNRFVKDLRFWKELEKMFNAGYFMELHPKKVVYGRFLYSFLLNVYMHDFDQLVENLNDEYRNIAVLCNASNHKDLKIQRHRSRRSNKFSIQMLQIYDKWAKYEKFVSNCAVSKGRSFEDVWKFCCVR
jgi:hypothetical protein